MPEAIETFSLNHPEAWSDARSIEDIKPKQVRSRLGLKKGELDLLAGGPPCQGFSINAPARFLSDPRNKLFKDYLRFLEHFKPKAFLFENVPGLLSLGNGKVFRQILRDVTRIAFGSALPLVQANTITDETQECVAVFGKDWGKELRLPSRGKSGRYFVDWVLAQVSAQGELIDFVAVEVQSIDTTGNYRQERETYLRDELFPGKSTAGIQLGERQQADSPADHLQGPRVAARASVPERPFLCLPNARIQENQREVGWRVAPVSNSARLADDHVVQHRRTGPSWKPAGACERRTAHHDD